MDLQEHAFPSAGEEGQSLLGRMDSALRNLVRLGKAHLKRILADLASVKADLKAKNDPELAQKVYLLEQDIQKLGLLVGHVDDTLQGRLPASQAEAEPEESLVVSTQDVCFGRARLANTRVPIWTLVRARRAGDSDATLLQDYPSLQQRHLDAAWAYYEQHREEIDEAIRYQDEEQP